MSFIKDFCKVVFISVLMCSLNAAFESEYSTTSAFSDMLASSGKNNAYSASASESEYSTTSAFSDMLGSSGKNNAYSASAFESEYSTTSVFSDMLGSSGKNISPPTVTVPTMRFSAQVEVDDLRPFVQNSAYSNASYVRFFFKHNPDIEIGRIDINNLVRCERIAINDTIQVPDISELVIAYDFRDTANQQVGNFYWVCASAEFPKGSVCQSHDVISIVNAVRIKAIVGVDGPDASPVRFGIIGVKYWVSEPYYAFERPSLVQSGTFLNDSALMREVRWIFAKDEAAPDAAAGKNEYEVSARDIDSRDNYAANQEGSNMYVSMDNVALSGREVLIAAKYIQLARKKYGRIPTVTEIGQLKALMMHYGLATSLTADNLAKELMALLAFLKDK